MTRDEKIYAELDTIEGSTKEIRRLLDRLAKPPDPEPDDPAVLIEFAGPWGPRGSVGHPEIPNQDRGLSLDAPIPDGEYSRFELSFTYKHGGWVAGAKRLELGWAGIGGNRKQLGYIGYARDSVLRLTWGSVDGGLSAPWDGKNKVDMPFRFVKGQTYRIEYAVNARNNVHLWVDGEHLIEEPSIVGPILANNRDVLRLHFSYDTPYPEEPPGWGSEWSQIRAALYA